MVKVVFLDTSALIKRCVEEKQSDQLARLIETEEKPDLFIAMITQAELYSAIMRRVREGSIDVSKLSDFETVFNSHNETEYNVVSTNQNVINQSCDLLKKYPLRAADAIQLSSALVAKRRVVKRFTQDFEFVCADKRLIEAATREKLNVVNLLNET